MVEFEKLNLTYLNRAYDRRLLELWEMESFNDSGIWREKSLLDYVGAHLGYRFVLQNVEGRRGWKPKTALSCFEIQNCGFGGFFFQEAELFLILKSGEKRETIPIPGDFSTWAGGEKKSLEIRIEPKIAELFLELRRKKDGKIIRFANEESADCLFLGSLRLCEK